jgi:hypothetical protein
LFRPYAGWAAIAVLVVAIFIGLIATNIALPLFLLFAAGALAAFRYWDALKTFDFWALDEWLRTRRDAIGVRSWQAPHQAAEFYCSPVVVKARNEAAAEMNSIMMELIRDPGRSRRTPAGAMFSTDTDSSRLEGAPSRSHAHYEAAQIRVAQCNAALSRELAARLARGDLLAKGLLMKDELALSERVIPTSRWRVLTLDIAKATAAGAGWSYSGILIGNKPPAASQAKSPDVERRPPTHERRQRP